MANTNQRNDDSRAMSRRDYIRGAYLGVLMAGSVLAGTVAFNSSQANRVKLGEGEEVVIDGNILEYQETNAAGEAEVLQLLDADQRTPEEIREAYPEAFSSDTIEDGTYHWGDHAFNADVGADYLDLRFDRDTPLERLDYELE
jgi:hypothetical protein